MTDQEEQNVAEPVTEAQDAPAKEDAPENATAPEPAQGLAAAAAIAAAQTPEETAKDADEDGSLEPEVEHGGTLAAYRGIPAGPPPHPRTV